MKLFELKENIRRPLGKEQSQMQNERSNNSSKKEEGKGAAVCGGKCGYWGCFEQIEK